MIILVGESGSGKSTIETLLQEILGFNKVISYTTRPLREGEVNGVNYHYVSVHEFAKLVCSDFFAETVEYRGNYYGMAKKDCKDDVVVVVEPNGLRQIKKIKGLNLITIYLEVPEKVRAVRMLERGDSFESVVERIYGDRELFKDIECECGYVVNAEGDLLSTFKEVCSILRELGAM